MDSFGESKLNTKFKLLKAMAISFVIMAPIAAHADIMTTLAMKAAQSYAEKAMHDTAMQEKILHMIQNDPGFKDRVVAGIKNIIADPKYAAHREKAIAFLSDVEKK